MFVFDGAGDAASISTTDGADGTSTGLAVQVVPSATGGGFFGVGFPTADGMPFDASNADDLTFYLRSEYEATTAPISLEVKIQEDPNGNSTFDPATEDEFVARVDVTGTSLGYGVVSIPLSSFVDSNAGGNGAFDRSRFFQVVFAGGGTAGGPFTLSFDEVALTGSAAGSIAVSPTELTVEEGDTAEVTVTLSRSPTDDVTIEVSSSDPNEAIASPARVTFEANTINLSRTITVEGVLDGEGDGPQSATILLGPAVSADRGFDGDDPRDVDVTVDDADTEVVRFTVVQRPVNEADGSATLEIELTDRPLRDAEVVSLESGDPADLGGFTADTLAVSSAPGAPLRYEVLVPITDDGVEEGDEVFVFQLSVLGDDPSVRVGSPARTAVVVSDNPNFVGDSPLLDNFEDGNFSNTFVYSETGSGIIRIDDPGRYAVEIRPAQAGGFAGFGVGVPQGGTADVSDAEALTFPLTITSGDDGTTAPFVAEVNLLEDTDGDGAFDASVDDQFRALVHITPDGETREVEVLLSAFTDNGPAGANDGFDFSRLLQVVFAIPGGNGLGDPFTLTIDEVAFVAQAVSTDEDEALEAFDLAVYPNPASDAAAVTFQLASSAQTTVDILDVLGRRVAVLADGLVPAGTVRYDIPSGTLPAGVYFVRVMAGTETITTRLTIAR